jgi:hypothetical protein
VKHDPSQRYLHVLEIHFSYRKIGLLLFFIA